MNLELNNAEGTAVIPVQATANGEMKVSVVAGTIGTVDTRTGKQTSDTITLDAAADAHETF